MPFATRFLDYFTDLSQSITREYTGEYINTIVYDHVKFYKTEEFPFSIDIFICNVLNQMLRLGFSQYTEHRVAISIIHPSLSDIVFVPYSPPTVNVLSILRRQLTGNIDLNLPFTIKLSYCSNKIKV